jgi:hypothetical protein
VLAFAAVFFLVAFFVVAILSLHLLSQKKTLCLVLYRSKKNFPNLFSRIER